MAAVSEVEVPLGERSYLVTISNGLLDASGELLARLARAGRLVVVSDELVWGLYGSRLSAALAGESVRAEPVLVASGEENKNWTALGALLERLLELGVERGDHILAFGGGAVGDIAGMAAAILKRGCGYALVPTTLLAQVDASIGGKTAVNVAAGKNLVGAFHQPAAVLIDPALLQTLPARELRAGYAEVVKYGLIDDPEFFGWCEANGARLIGGDETARLHAIETSVRAKARIVSQDEREASGRRALLNLGHTFGHAVEAVTGFSDRVRHGEAVALGMTLAFSFSASRGLCPADDAERLERHLRSIELPTTFGQVGIDDPRLLLGPMTHDKKRVDGRLSFILARGIGEAFVERTVEAGEVEAFLADAGS